MDAGMRRSTKRSPRRPSARLLCLALVAGAFAYVAPSATGAEVPTPPTVGGYNGENLSIGIYWGLYEELGAQPQDSIGVVGAPMPFLMQLMDNGENRLFIFIQHRLAGGPYCAETPAQMEDVSVELTAAAGDPTIGGPAYTKTYLWTPTEPGEYAFCAYLDATPSGDPVAKNFLKLTADPAPGRLSFSVAPEAEDPQRSSVQIEGSAVVASELTASVQAQGLACTLPEGQLAGQALFESPGGAAGESSSRAVEPGPFTASYSFAAAKPGAYEVCAYLVPAPNEKMNFWRPYEVGSYDLSVEEAQVAPAQNAQIVIPASLPPALSAVSMSNSRFRVASGRAHAAGHAPIGTTFRFAVSASATVTITIKRLLPGVMRGHSCVPSATAGPADTRRCTRSVSVGSIARSLALAGDHSIPFRGVVGHGKLLAGSYVASITANNDNGRSEPVSMPFTIAP
jgi:hypothetical protein